MAERPVFLWDGECGFCRRWIERWRETVGDGVEFAPSQEAGARFPHVAPERYDESAVFVEPEHGMRTTYGAEAVFRSLAYAPRGGRRWLRAYERVPGFAATTNAAYRLIARNRRAFSRLTRWGWGGEARRSRYALVRWTFLRGIALVYLTAFLSLWVQVEGLIGSRGILPLAPWLDTIASRFGGPMWREMPTLFWLGASDTALHAVCALGVAAALALLVNVVPGPASVVAWASYLSLYTAGRVFLSFQWDILLLESGVIAALWAPWRARARAGEPASRAPLWLARWLVFRLMFLSGAVKLLSGDPAWRDLSAMAYHYETQPLPAWTSWYAHHLPATVHQAETALTFVLELVLPFLIFLPRRPRLAAFAGFVGLQLVIAATGNYGFFNLLTAVLCIALLDDGYLRRVPWLARLARAGDVRVRDDIRVRDVDRGRCAEGVSRPASSSRSTARVHSSATASPQSSATASMRLPLGSRSIARRAVRFVSVAAAAFLFVLSTANFVGRLRGYEAVPPSVQAALAATAPFHLTSSYGLFAVMTKERPEIIVEGSRDGVEWKPYDFRWKPDALDERPRFVQPHMPRLDWQMWFAALGDYRRNPWFIELLRRLLDGSPPVLALLANDPFEGTPPAYVRATVYEYRFTKPGSREAEAGAWWTRENPRPYAPVLRRSDGF